MGKIDHNKSPVWRQGDGFGDFEAKKQTSEQWWNIYIKRDQTPMQRNYLKKVLQELEQYTKEGRNNYKIRYQLNST